MRFFRILQYDFRQGILVHKKRCLWVMLLAVFLFLNFILSVYQSFYFFLDGFLQINSLHVSFGDVMLGTVGGIFPYIPGMQRFTVPAVWLCVYLLCFYFTLSYAHDDFSEGGVQVIIRAKSKLLWWLSKCLWNMLTVSLYFLLLYGVLFLLCLATRKELSFSLNADIFKSLLGFRLPEISRSSGQMFAALCILPWLTAVAVSLVQMVLTLLAKPVFAYIIIGIWLIAGVYYANELMLPNYALSVRNITIGVYGFRTGFGIFLCLLVSMLAVTAGAAVLCRRDMLPTH